MGLSAGVAALDIAPGQSVEPPGRENTNRCSDRIEHTHRGMHAELDVVHSAYPSAWTTTRVLVNVIASPASKSSHNCWSRTQCPSCSKRASALSPLVVAAAAAAHGVQL